MSIFEKQFFGSGEFKLTTPVMQSSSMNNLKPDTVIKIAPGNRTLKRMMDIVLAVAMLIAFGPLIVFIAAWIYLSTGLSPVYKHQRVGFGASRFYCLKFRTMVANADDVLEELLSTNPALRQSWEQSRKLPNDPRIIPGVGLFLRKTSLDELPQIFNVLRGDMSLVGPRPVTEDEMVFYGVHIGHYAAVRPGLTGLWQISGRSDTTYAERVAKDVWYVEHAGVATDLRIFFITAKNFILGRLTGAI